jgi:presenilin-like A22 family membrane protease
MPEDIENQKPEEIISAPVQKPWRIFAIEAFLFCLTLWLGISNAFEMNEYLKIKKAALPTISFWQFLLYFFLATLFILLISRFVKFKKGKGILFKGIFVLVTFLGGLLALEFTMPSPLALLLMVFFVFYWLIKPSVLIHDLCIILGIAGVGSVLGLSLNPLMVVALLVIFSIYDFIAVYKTKHMVKMAKEMIESKAILALIIPSSFRDFRGSLGEVKPGGKFLVLGGGDVVFPLLFSASLVSISILDSLIVAIFSLIGLFVGFLFFTKQKERKPIPALPPIAFFSIIGFLITRLV